MAGPTSAIVVRLRLPLGLQRLRRERDQSAGLGVPAHVTILYPFLPRAALTDDVRRYLLGLAGEIRAFEVRFECASRWPGVVYLEPIPREPFSALIDRVVESWPALPPYAGAVDEVIPHLTIVEGPEPLDEILAAVPAFLPFAAHAAGLDVLAQTDAGRWRTRWRLPFKR